MNYPHTLHITRADSQGSVNATTGRWEPSGDPVTVYQGAVDAQEQRGLMIAGSDPATKQANLSVFLKDESAINMIDIGDRGTLTRGQLSQQVIVRKVRRLDTMIEVDADE